MTAGALIPAFQKNQALLDDIKLADETGESFSVWWLGQSGFLLKWKSLHILMDPYLSDSLTKKYANTAKPHTRISERIIDPAELGFINILSSSHNHTDHLDAETVVPILHANSQLIFIIPEANRKFVAERMGIDELALVGLNDKSTITVGDIKLHGVVSCHNTIDRDENGNPKYMGYVFEFGRWKVYHSGDTLLYPGMEESLRPFQIDLALLPINGNDPARGVAGNLDATEAARLAKSINARMVIPCHYDMFSFNTSDPSEFATEAEKIGQPFAILRQGEKWNSDTLLQTADKKHLNKA